MINLRGKNIYSKFILILLTILSINTASFSYNLENEGKLEDDVILVGGDNDYPPYEFIDRNGSYRGFNIDIIRAIADVMDLKVQLIPLPWELAIKGLEDGDLDVIQGMTKTDIRLKKFAFTEKTTVNFQNIFVRAKTTYISDLIDLSGHKISFQKYDVNVEHIKTFSSIELLEYENQSEAINALLNFESDAFIGNRATGVYNLQKMNKLNEVKIVGEPIGETEYAIASRIENKEILNVFNEGLLIIRENGEYDKIYNKWFGESFSDNSEKLMKSLVVVVVILFVVLIVFQIIVLINRRLKEEVENRTKELTFKQLELEKTNREKGNIINTIESGIIAFSSNLEVTLFNSSSEEILAKEIYIGQNWDDLSFDNYNIDGLEELNHTDSYRKTSSFTNFSGEKRYIDYTISKILGPEGVEGIILFLHDYTSEKILQDIISHDDKITTLGRLLAGITHEIKNPLNSIKNYVERLPAKKDDPEFLALFERVVDEEVNRLSSMVTNVLDFSKNGVITVDEVSMEDVIENILLLFKVKIVETRVKISYDLKNVKIRADVQQIKQILINIILNSIEALDYDGTGNIDISSYETEGKVHIVIKDNGYGIPEELIDRVFDPFYTSKEDGYGVGLYITKQLVTSNEGQIQIDSNEDDGTSVTLSFNKFE
ncbi:MAG: transporter substrate-binding domain-containing protein [Acidaminobacteraceae bacterium]